MIVRWALPYVTVAHSEPEKPVAHVQLNVAIPSVQVPPFRHGALEHSAQSNVNHQNKTETVISEVDGVWRANA
jgi:hypothetical protein